MIRHTAVSTDQRKANIEQQVNSIQYNRSPNLAAFGISVNDKKFLEVPARQLPPPNIEYSNGVVTPAKGQWRMDFGNKNFLKPADCLKWCVLNTDSRLDRSNLDSFVTEVFMNLYKFELMKVSYVENNTFILISFAATSC